MNDMYSTGMLYDSIAKSESIEEYKKILESLENQRNLWVKIVRKIMLDEGYSAKQMAELCGVSRQTVQKWLNGSIPKSRETYIKIGFAAHYTLEEMNSFLQRYGGCNKLYPKCLEDSVYIFVLSSDEIEHTYEMCRKIIEMIKDELTVGPANAEGMSYETSAVSWELIRLRSAAQMLAFVQEKAAIFKKRYSKFYDYVDVFIEKNLLDEDDSVYLLANSQQWSSSLRQCVSEISQKKWYPQRNKIISLGIHLNMDVEEINEMLRLAQMEELCAKIPFESAIIYALENAKLEGVIACDGTDELCRYVKKILEGLEFEMVNFFLEELPKDDD